jgi:hypothetical protein
MFGHAAEGGYMLGRHLIRWIRALPACVLLGIPVSSIGSSSEGLQSEWKIEGFLVQQGGVSKAAVEDVLPSIRRQINIVLSVKLPEEVLRYMRTVPIVISNRPSEYRSEGLYGKLNGRWVVELVPENISSARPVLLHELLHAYHREFLAASTEIPMAYEKALRSSLRKQFPDAHFLSSEKEFLAVLASTYLFGRIQQPPYVCSALPSDQQEFLGFLEKVFGHHTCR